MGPGAESGAAPAPRICKRCGRAEAEGARFRNSQIHGQLVRRLTCRACENVGRAARRSGLGPSPRGTTFAFGDLHAPFTHLPTLDAAIVLLAKTPDVGTVVQVGDGADFFAQSKFPRNPSVMTPAEELERAREMLEGFWHRVREAAPRAKCYQLLGNHDARPLKRALDRAPELLEFILPSVRAFHQFEGVTTIEDPSEELILNGIVFQHGYHSRLGYHATRNATSTVHGHTHHGGVWFRSDSRGTIWELDAGCLVDEGHPAFSYRMQKKLDGITRGVGIIDPLGPRFVLL